MPAIGKMACFMSLILLSACQNSPSSGSTNERLSTFRLFDLNSDQSISRTEWATTIAKTANALPDRTEAQKFESGLLRTFDKLDTNGDGRIEINEWLSGRFEYSSTVNSLSLN